MQRGQITTFDKKNFYKIITCEFFRWTLYAISLYPVVGFCPTTCHFTQFEESFTMMRTRSTNSQ